MANPTGPVDPEKSIYKSKVHNYEVRARVVIDYPTPTSLFSEDFGGPNIDTTYWAFFYPEGANITLDGQLTVEVDTINAPNGILRPATVWSKPNKIFPTNKSDIFSIEWRCRPVYASTTDVTQTYMPTAFRIAGIDNNQSIGGSIISIDYNQQLGTRLMMPDGTVVNDLGMDSSFHTYRLDFDTDNYYFYMDGALQGTLAATLGFLTYRGADFISIGVPSISSNINAQWTGIQVDYIHMISADNIPENPVVPDWATTTTTIDGVKWGYLPNILSGSVNVDKDNDTDGCELVCLGYYSLIDGGRRNLLSGRSTTLITPGGFQFPNRDIVVESRVSDGQGNWTSWKQIFYGTIDDAQYEVTESEDITVRFSCRDKYRRMLARSFITASFADFSSTNITGIPNARTVSNIVQYILLLAGVPVDKWAIQDVNLVPKVINFVNQSGLSIIQELADDIVWEVFVDHKSDAKLHFQDWVFDVSDPYTVSTSEEVFLVNRTLGTSSQTGQIEMTFEQANLDPFFTVYPYNRWPPDAAVIQVPSRIVQTPADLSFYPSGHPLHVTRWRRENRLFGSVEVTMSCQDWMEMNIGIIVDDPDFLGLNNDVVSGVETGPIFMIHGWEYTWTDDKDFTTKMILALQEVDLLKALRRFV